MFEKLVEVFLPINSWIEIIIIYSYDEIIALHVSIFIVGILESVFLTKND